MCPALACMRACVRACVRVFAECVAYMFVCVSVCVCQCVCVCVCVCRVRGCDTNRFLLLPSSLLLLWAYSTNTCQCDNPISQMTNAAK